MNQDNCKRQYIFKAMLSLNTTQDANKDPKQLLTAPFQFYRNIPINISQGSYNSHGNNSEQHESHSNIVFHHYS